VINSVPDSESAAEWVFPDEEWEEASSESQGVDARRLQEAMDCLAGICLDQGTEQSLVVRNGRLIWQGPDVDNKHTVWSCTKTFMSAAFGLLVDDGKCSPDTLAADADPRLRELYPAVTLRQFASFTSGYAHVDVDHPFDPVEPLYAPGEYFHYSQSSDELAHVLARIAGEPLRDLFRRRIADRIGMKAGEWSWGDWGVVDGIAVCGGSGSYEKGISITARQMARFGMLYATGGRWRGRQLLSREWIEESCRPQMPNTLPPFDAEAWYLRLPGSYGLNIWLNGITPGDRRMWPDAPPGTVAIQGNMNNICFAIPEWRMVLVRMGTDGRIDLDRYTDVFAALRRALRD